MGVSTDLALAALRRSISHNEPERFVKVIAGYALMIVAELCLNTFIKRDRTGKYVVSAGTRISLDPNFVFRAEKRMSTKDLRLRVVQ